MRCAFVSDVLIHSGEAVLAAEVVQTVERQLFVCGQSCTGGRMMRSAAEDVWAGARRMNGVWNLALGSEVENIPGSDHQASLLV